MKIKESKREDNHLNLAKQLKKKKKKRIKTQQY